MGKKSVIIFICALLAIALGGLPVGAASEGPDRYTAVTADGARLAMKRYRPDSRAGFNKGAQPIILMPALATSMNEFDVRTPPGEKYKLRMPAQLEPWASGDKYIQNDNMRYHSLAHYLWRQGYDVWMVNYRGEGRTPYRSTGAWGSSIDDLGIYDVPAVVEKVYSLTRKHPIYLGHSTGATMAYIYLQGARYGPGPNPHVVSDPALVKERNGGSGPQSIKAFVDVDGPMVTFTGTVLDNPLMWDALYWPWYVDLRPILVPIGNYLADPMTLGSEIVYNFLRMLGLPDLGPINVLASFSAGDLQTALNQYGAKYCFDGSSTRVLAQFSDAAAHGIFREDYANGTGAIIPPDPAPGDGYYVYTYNLNKIKLPSLVLADGRRDITNPDDIKSFYLKKTRNSLDKFVLVKGVAHCDIAFGERAPGFVFPTIGAWLKRACR
jgi:Serine aminopeptidase, S33